MDEILTVDEAAAYLKVCSRTVYRLVEARKLPAKKVGGQWRLHRANLEKYFGVPQPRQERA